MNFRVYSAAIVATSFIASAPVTHSQQQGLPLVKAIDVQYVGQQSVSKEKILANMRTRVGKPYSPQITEEDVRNLYATGNLNNVRIFGEPAGDGVKVIVVVAAKSTISEVLIQGATRIRTSKIRDEISTKPGEALSEAGLNMDKQKIIELYQNKGYSDVDVKARVEKARDGNSQVIFDIAEGSRTKISSVEFQGNTVVKRRELLKAVKTKPKGVLNILSTTAGKMNNDQLEADRAAIRSLYESKGYIDVQVPQPTVTRRDTKVDVTFTILEGQQYRVNKATYSGAQVFPLDELTKGLKLKAGEVYSPQNLAADRKAIGDLYGSRGYLELQVIPSVTPAGKELMDVSFQLVEGIQYYVDKVNIGGNTRTKDKVIRRELALAPGDVFNTVRMDASQKRLENLRYFGPEPTTGEPGVSIRPAEPLTSVPGRRDMEVKVNETSTGRFEFGAGFSSVDNLLGYVQFRESNFDIGGFRTGRFRGGGQKFNFRAQYGARRKDFLLSLTEPYFLDQKFSLGGELYYRDASFQSRVYDERRYGTAINVRKPINDFTSARFEYRLENVGLHDFDEDVSEEIRQEEGDRLKSQLSIELNYDTRNRVYLPNSGHRVSFLSYAAGGFLGGDVDIYGFDLEASKYFALPGNTILTLEAQVAGVDTWGGGDRVPIYDRLYLGGQNSLRGFRYRDVGPKDVDGEPVGGQTLARFTIEYTFPIAESVRGALFYDVGFVSRDAWDFSGNVNSDVGIGLLLELPVVGPMRIDYGIPLQADEDNDSGGKFHVNVGYKF
jgi:outer membrane protein insertion porin family